MKYLRIILFTFGIIALSACNFTLAEDVTPPANYVPPTPRPTLGPLYPAQAPDIKNGAAIYAEKCAPCHGETGLGDGPRGKGLSITVPVFALPEIAHPSSPSEWYSTVMQGDPSRFEHDIPGITNQQVWDAVSYAFTLHTKPNEIQQGKELFESNCAQCHADGFTQEAMAKKSAEAIMYLAIKGHDTFPASKLSEEEGYALADYARTLTFATVSVAEAPTTLPTPVTDPVTPTADSASTTPIATDAASSPISTEAAPVGTDQAQVTTEASAAKGNVVRGVVENKTGKALPAGLDVTLHGYEHGSDPNAGAQEVFTETAPLQADGSYVFENVEMSARRLFVSEITFEDMTLQSDFAVVQEGAAELIMPSITLYGTTTELTSLIVENASVHFDFTNPDSVMVFIVYTMRNTGDKTIVVALTNDNQEIPFIKSPANSEGVGFQATQDSATFIGSEDGSSFAMPPTETAYGLVQFANLPKSDPLDFSQQFILPVGTAHIFVPEGVTVSGNDLIDSGVTPMQDQNGQSVNFQTYSVGIIEANGTLAFSLSGSPKTTAAPAEPAASSNQPLLIGVGALGIALIVAGAWLFLRDRRAVEEDEDDNEQYESSDEIMDAILALDDLHRSGKIDDDAHQKRRDELKEELKKKS